MWIDTHCHLQMGEQEMDGIQRAVEEGVDKFVCVGTDPETSRQAVELSLTPGERIFATIGLHPHDAKEGISETISFVDQMIAIPDNRIVGIGECGLDYYYEHSPRDIQREVFIAQIELSKKHDLALIIHTRDAWTDTFDILRSEGVPSRTVVHCFTGGPAEAEIALDLGLHLSFSGIVTFPKAAELRKAAGLCPVDRMTIETDSPFLAPVPYRGKPNEPAYLPTIGRFISDLKGLPIDNFAASISRVSTQLFNLQ